MSWTQDDIAQIRSLFEEYVAPIAGELEALRNDIKEIYGMLAKLQGGTVTDESFQKLGLEEKILKLNAELLAAAKQAGITLPR